MPELGPYGSVRGAFSNGRPYRNSGAPIRSKAYVNFASEGAKPYIHWGARLGAHNERFGPGAPHD
jgi:hypothetical protein